MPCLHQLNHSSKLNHCLTFIAEGDSLLLLEAATSLAIQSDWLACLPKQVKVYVLAQDLKARALQALDGITLIDDSRWVELTLEAKSVCTW